MKVILLEDIEKLGTAGKIVSVSDGYARNFLFPKGYALAATPGILKNLERLQKDYERKKLLEEENIRQLAERLQGVEVRIPAKVGREGRLYGAITQRHIADAIEKATGLKVDPRTVEIERPIRIAGTYSVPLRLKKDLHPSVTVEIYSETPA
ncbi:MAG: 50S ribosomal protein L9 [bacterium JZ-2024 1]